jgi:hypothetical protein
VPNPSPHEGVLAPLFHPWRRALAGDDSFRGPSFMPTSQAFLARQLATWVTVITMTGRPARGIVS